MNWGDCPGMNGVRTSSMFANVGTRAWEGPRSDSGADPAADGNAELIGNKKNREQVELSTRFKAI